MSNKTVVMLIAGLLVLSGVLYIKYQLDLKNINSQLTSIPSIKEAYKSGMSVQCIHEEPNGSVRVFVRDGGLRFDNTLPNYKGMVRHYVNKNDVSHIWRNDRGIIFRDISRNTYGEVSPLFITTNQALDMVAAYKDSCVIARFEDEIFDNISNVSFTEVRTNAEAAVLPKEL